jgi:uncharacterized protein YcbX
MSDQSEQLPMLVQSLWRYPVKSMQGETCQELDMESNGVAGDRSWGVLDLTSNTVISAKRDGRLLEALASLTDGEVRVRLPGAQELDPRRRTRRESHKMVGTSGQIGRSSVARRRHIRSAGRFRAR